MSNETHTSTPKTLESAAMSGSDTEILLSPVNVEGGLEESAISHNALDASIRARAATLLAHFETARRRTESLVGPLHREDMVVQSMEDTSPTKWHLAHTTWFFETFVLSAHCPGYKLFDDDFPYLFNSYYVQAGPRFARARRGMITRPTVDQTMEYRRYVNKEMASFLQSEFIDAGDSVDSEVNADFDLVSDLLTLGINHEQQHQELLMTDVKHLLHQNPLRPVYASAVEPEAAESGLGWVFFEEGIREIGRDEDASFMFDNEGPRHRVFLDSFWIADRLTTAREYLAFVEDGGYHRPELWLSPAWSTVEQEQWGAPIYWEKVDGSWYEYTFNGLVPLRMDAPVCHVSYFEADAFARWAEARLPTEFEWEAVAQDNRIDGNFVESGELKPVPLGRRPDSASHVRQLHGDVWEWTRSQYSPYPRYAPVEGAIGEYNGKFMCNQFVLRGGSCLTPRSHIRTTYRNFFPPQSRWQFSGIRLASDVTAA